MGQKQYFSTLSREWLLSAVQRSFRQQFFGNHYLNVSFYQKQSLKSPEIGRSKFFSTAQ